MRKFPKQDNEFMVIKAAAVAEHSPTIERVHDMAERENQFFAYGHTTLSVTAYEIFEARQHEAFVSGIRAYEVIGLDELDVDQHRRYGTGYILNILAQMEHDSNFSLHFLEDAERAITEASIETPHLVQAVEIIAATELGDSSSELARFALCGAATMRDAQLDVDQLLDLEDALGE